jgi:hypothetical protein
LLPNAARADQFVLFDATFTYTWDDATNATPSKSHYYVNEGNWLNKGRPGNWMSPINYRDGKVHIRAEVLEKPPGDQTAGWALCYVANMGDYGCPYTDYYTKTGVYERDVAMTTFWNNATIQWDKGIKQVDLVYTINDSGSGHITNFPEKKDLTTPTKVRITMVQVSSGATYDPGWIGQSDAGPRTDAGSISDGSVRDVADAGIRADRNDGTVGTGGSIGSGGLGGAGGSGGAAATGGTTGGGGTVGTGGAAGTGTAGNAGSSGTGGSPGSGGSGNGSTDGAGGSGPVAAGGSNAGSEPDAMGCGCSLARNPRPRIAAGIALLAVSLLATRRRDLRRARRRTPCAGRPVR